MEYRGACARITSLGCGADNLCGCVGLMRNGHPKKHGDRQTYRIRAGFGNAGQEEVCLI